MDTGVPAQGPKGDKGDTGIDGEDGLTPHIGENGNWWIGETDTEIPATGPKGDTGEQGPQGEPGKDGNGIESIELTNSSEGVDMAQKRHLLLQMEKMVFQLQEQKLMKTDI